MKITAGEWLKDIRPYTIYNHDSLAKDLMDKTGIEDSWSTHSAENVAARMGSFKELEYVTSLDHEKVCFGWEIAEALQKKLLGLGCSAPFQSFGSRFRAAHRAILKSGL